MKVLVGIPCLLAGGTEIQTLNLVKALVLGGHKVTTVCYFEWLPEFVKYYQEAGSEVICLSPTSPRPEGIAKTFRFLVSSFKHILKSQPPDIIHLQYMAPGAMASVAFRIAGAKKIICTTHTSGDIYSSAGLKIFRWLSDRLFQFTQCISLNAEKSYFGTAEQYKIGRKVVKGSHATIYNALPAHIAIRRGKKSASELITIGVVSRIEEIKGMDLVIPAFKAIAQDFKNANLLVVGEGALLNSMIREAEESGHNDRIIFYGRVPKDELENYYDRIDILLVPSRSEGFGLTALEGMARGCVPLVSGIGGLTEVVTPDCGVIHIAGNLEDLKRKLTDLLAHPSELSHKSEAAIRRAEEFSFERYSSLINSVYSHIL